MEMKKINENTIRVLLENEDLTERGITVLDLLGNHKEIEKFFYKILDEVDKDHEFRDTDAVTFQVMPNRNGLELLITKANKEGGKSGNTPEKNQNANQTLADATASDDTLSDYIKNHIFNNFEDEAQSNDRENAISDDGDGVSGYVDDPNMDTNSIMVEFNSFEDFLSLANLLHDEHLVSNLYFYNKKYYLEIVMFSSEVDSTERKNISALAHEYGKAVDYSPEFLDERGKVVMENAALQVARYYFLKNEK